MEDARPSASAEEEARLGELWTRLPPECLAVVVREQKAWQSLEEVWLRLAPQ